jgi:hypothetical protein
MAAGEAGMKRMSTRNQRGIAGFDFRRDAMPFLERGGCRFSRSRMLAVRKMAPCGEMLRDGACYRLLQRASRRARVF